MKPGMERGVLANAIIGRPAGETSLGSTRGKLSSPQRSSPMRIVLSLLLVVYWLSMFSGTHIPEVPSVFQLVSDKVMHAAAYFGLSVLLLVWQSTRQTVVWKTILGFWVLIATYGAFDEFTQQFFARTTDFWDWLADMTGVTAGLGLTWLILLRIQNKKRGQQC